ncbi:hypothetical protein [Peribacillus simplex]|uniref:hypothetical protein n=1 Tax=Peribacillus simplex TaxID=1478 RepID=UPI003D2E2EF2
MYEVNTDINYGLIGTIISLYLLTSFVIVTIEKDFMSGLKFVGMNIVTGLLFFVGLGVFVLILFYVIAPLFGVTVVMIVGTLFVIITPAVGLLFVESKMPNDRLLFFGGLFLFLVLIVNGIYKLIDWMMTNRQKLSEINRKYEIIMESNEPQYSKSTKLAHLMTDMEGFFSIPMMKNEEWENKNRKVIDLYRKISRSRVFDE